MPLARGLVHTRQSCFGATSVVGTFLMMTTFAARCVGEHATPTDHTAQHPYPRAETGRSGARTRGLRGKDGDEKLRKDLKEAVDAALGAGHGIEQQRLEAIRREIGFMWRSLAKKQHDRIDRRSLRYCVHRYFLHKYSLSIVGLEPAQASSLNSEVALLTSYAPTYVRTIIEGQGTESGFLIEDAAGMIAAVEHFLEASGTDMLEAVYSNKGMDVRADVNRQEIQEIMESFMLRWMLNNDEDSIALLEANHSLRQDSFDDWSDIAEFAYGRVSSFEYSHNHPMALPGEARRARGFNSLRARFSFADAQALVGGIAFSFGRFWETECATVKETLMSLDRTSSGRVKLSAFHHAALQGEWRFSESKEYLRQMGALDESSSWHGPRVIITNYMQAPSNCIITTQHYRVCCANECEHYLRELETSIQFPSATPEEILPIIRRLTAGFDEEPRLTKSLISQLHEIGRVHDGKVPIHGRLFSQWLHYVFPTECPFPHKSGTTITLTPLEFGSAYMASKAEMSNHSQQQEANANYTASGATEDWMSQWSHEEELLTDHLSSLWEGDFDSSLFGVVLAAIFACIALLHKSGATSWKNGKDVLPTRKKSHHV